MAPSHDRMIRYWDKQAPGYDARTSRVERRWLRHSRRWVGERAEGATLEIAVGTGATIPYYRADVTLTAVDWSGEMLDAARARAASLPRRVDMRVADAQDLPFGSGSFDTVVVTFALCCAPDPAVVLQESVRVLRPGGHLLLADHIVSSAWPVRMLQRVVESVTARLQGEHFTRRPLDTLRTLPVDVVETERLTLGMIERVHARTR